ncbi:MAG: DegT/DnrJ/EryC1/StrS family aminotransferase [Actinomycetota bacterium]|nr:DegT/DnrJ/EryC1/StrS family aminotransferase [Actinomycetota bacterium]MDQ5808684.1 DegT/DnrJ/EryC1/StrS family aminotransferase [Actinomycetota bacterium]
MADQIPFVDLHGPHLEIAAALRAAFDRVLDTSAFILGREVDEFEREFAAYCGTADSVGVASGTAAITLMVQATGIGPGDEVVVPAHTYVASALGVAHAGATPVFCDVDPDTGLIDPAAADAAITERTAAILCVHLYGQVCDMRAMAAVAERHGVALLEDGAQAHGATWDDRRAGSFGRAAAFSFYPSKNLGALGDGGAITTSDPAVAAKARELRNIGQRAKGEHVSLGWNERLDGLQAALLREKLPHLDRWNADRMRAAAALERALPEEARPLVQRPESPSIFHVFPIRVGDRDAVAEHLASRGIATGVHYSPAVHRQPPFLVHGHAEDAFPAAAAWAAQELSLPMFPGLTDEQVARIGEACHEAIPTGVA